MGGLCSGKGQQATVSEPEGKTSKREQKESKKTTGKKMGSKDISLIGSGEYRKKKRGNKIGKQRHDEEGGKCCENIKPVEVQITKQQMKYISRCLKKHFVFQSLSKHELKSVAKKMFFAQVQQGIEMIKQGDDASSFFIVQKGELDVIIDGQFRRKLQKGDQFGELALLYNAPRSATIKAKTDCELWGIDRSTFRQIIEEICVRNYESNRAFLDTIPFFKQMTEGQKDAIAGVIMLEVFRMGEDIVCQGDQASSYYLIMEGEVSVIINGDEVNVLEAGGAFGEAALYEDTTRGGTCRARTQKVICLSLGREVLQKILGNQIHQAFQQNKMKWAVNQDKLLKRLTKLQQEKILSSCNIKEFKDETSLCEKGKLKNSFIWICIKGGIKTQSGKVICETEGIFGSEFLQRSMKDQKFEEDVFALAGSIIAQLDETQIQEIFQGDYEDVMERNKNSHENLLNRDNSAKQEYARTMKINEFINVKKLGFGQFGVVQLCVRKTKKGELEEFAVKVVCKGQVIQQSLESHVINEKRICAIVDHPNIMSFFRTYQDEENIYFILEYIRGQELFDAIRVIGLLGTSDSQYFIGSILLAMEYLHHRHTIYRDLKPENVMIDDHGVLKVIDMGTAKKLTKKPYKTFTIIGTPHYMAPEVLKNKGYSFEADLWSLGVMLFEFMCGYCPFGEEAEDPYEIYQEILSGKLEVPEYMKDKNALSMMKRLLNQVAEKRLGGSFANLKNHRWFKGFDFDKLAQGQMKPTYVPDADDYISKEEVKKAFVQGVTCLEAVKQDHSKDKFKKRKLKSKIPNWESEF